MSEHQYVAFRAIDGPVSEKNLEFMRKQSSRPEITPWSFENEYHYGDFRGSGYASWLKKQPVARKNEWLTQLMSEPNSSVRRELLTEYRETTNSETWPVVKTGRTMEELLREAGELGD